jgi:hypothetical protein
MSTTSRIRARRLAVAAAATLGLAALAAPAPGAGYGKDACLNGYVWRGASPADHVCVTPLVRMQTAQENDLAAARRDPAGGPFGADTCRSGFVWREAFPADHVCVPPPRRQQALDDNAQAAARRDTVHVWLTLYRPPQPPCTGDVCSRTSDDAQRYRVRADHLNVGVATVLLHRTDTGRERVWHPRVGPNANAPGGLLVFASGMLRCTPGAPNAYFAVRDPVSGIWSARIAVRTGCATL